MKKIIKRIFKDIFICHLLLFSIIFLIVNEYFLGDINFIPRYICLSFLVILSISYFILSKLNPLDRKEDKNKFALIIRNVFFRFGIVILFTWLKILFSSFGFEIKKDFQELFFLLLSYQFIFSLMAIVFGIKFISLFFIMMIAFPIMIVLGVFDIKWWALITGFITLWNYLNSEDFLYFLRRGKKLPEIPKELRYRWSTNKLVAYLLTFIFYLSFLISSFFEKKQPKDILEYIGNAQMRVYSMLGVLTILMVLGGIITYYFYLLYSKKDKWILGIGNKLGLKRFDPLIRDYIKAKKGELK